MMSKSPAQASGPTPGSAPKPVEVALAVILGRPGPPWRVLVARRLDEAVLGGFWEFPGGKRERGEPLAETARREAREELDVEVRILRPLTPVHHAYPHAVVTLHPFLAVHTSGQPRPLQVSAWRWVDVDELRTLEFPPANRALVEEVAALRDLRA